MFDVTTPDAQSHVPDVLIESHRIRKELWRRRLLEARARYDAAVEELRRTIEATSELPQADDWQEILEIRFRESDALSDYISALRTFTQLA